MSANLKQNPGSTTANFKPDPMPQWSANLTHNPGSATANPKHDPTPLWLPAPVPAGANKTDSTKPYIDNAALVEPWNGSGLVQRSVDMFKAIYKPGEASLVGNDIIRRASIRECTPYTYEVPSVFCDMFIWCANGDYSPCAEPLKVGTPSSGSYILQVVASKTEWRQIDSIRIYHEPSTIDGTWELVLYGNIQEPKRLGIWNDSHVDFRPQKEPQRIMLSPTLVDDQLVLYSNYYRQLAQGSLSDEEHVGHFRVDFCSINPGLGPRRIIPSLSVACDCICNDKALKREGTSWNSTRDRIEPVKYRTAEERRSRILQMLRRFTTLDEADWGNIRFDEDVLATA